MIYVLAWLMYILASVVLSVLIAGWLKDDDAQ